MTIVTLTTDLGLRDHYVAVVKGELLKAALDAQIIDISHEIEAFNISEAAFALKNSYAHFPEGTYHLVGVDTQAHENTSFLIVQHAGYTFMGPDNGIFSLLFEEGLPEKIYRIKTDISKVATDTFPLSSIIIGAFRHLVQGKKITEIGEATKDIQVRLAMRPIFTDNFIRASVIHFDHFENAILNVRKSDFDKVSKGRSFILHFHRNDDVRELSRNYFDGANADILCFFNSSGYLELAMNHGNVQSLLGIRLGDTVQLTFR